MWIDDQGVCHTVALPDPTTLMSTVFRDSLDRLLATSGEAVAEVLGTEEARFYKDRARTRPDGTDEAEFVRVAAPEVLTDSVGTIDDLRSQIRRVDCRWRLDALVALDDYVS